ncbi:MAG TPA: type II toxin-antitoxin system VapC family toxin [Gemmataceae bacterium]|jgi:predicted nucleic acid-binding protein
MAKRRKGTRPKARAFVLDCSIAMAWFFRDEADAYAEAVQDALTKAEAIVPATWPLEVVNTLVVGERRKRSTEAQATTWLSYLRTLPIVVDDETAMRAWGDTLSLARAHQLSAYDAAYLELVLRRGLPLATLDDKLKAAATVVGVAEYKPS